MAQEYFDKIIELISPIIEGKHSSVNFVFKHFFSGAALYANDKICMTLSPAGFAVKLPGEQRESLIKDQGAIKLRYFPKAPIKKDYVILPDNITNDQAALSKIVDVCIIFVTKG